MDGSGDANVAYLFEDGANEDVYEADCPSGDLTAGSKCSTATLNVLATGGTVNGTVELVQRLKGEIVGLAFLVELGFLKGRDRLTGQTVTSVITY